METCNWVMRQRPGGFLFCFVFGSPKKIRAHCGAKQIVHHLIWLCKIDFCYDQMYI